MTGLPVLRRNDRMNLSWDGVAYELESGHVLLVALVCGIDEVEHGTEKARADAVNRAFALLPPGYGTSEPCGDWIDLTVHGIFGYGRKFLAKSVGVKP